MSLCIKGMHTAYNHDKAENLNGLLRFQTPYSIETRTEEIASNAVSCACIPLKLAEAAGMIAWGALQWPIPFLICKMRTEHHDTEVYIRNFYPWCRTPDFPCAYNDIYSIAGEIKSINSWGWGFNEEETFEGLASSFNRETLNDLNAESTITGYNCISSGISKIVSTLLSMVSCPFACIHLSFIKRD